MKDNKETTEIIKRGIEITHYCPKCGAYSGDTFDLIEIDKYKQELGQELGSMTLGEKIKCNGCGWEGYWSQDKIFNEMADSVINVMKNSGITAKEAADRLRLHLKGKK